MPTPSPDSTGARLSRRAALAAVAAAGAALVGCTPEDQPSGSRTKQEKAAAPVDPDVAVAAEALASQREVLGLLVATRKRHRGLSRQLSPVVAAHEAHASLLADAVPKDVPASASAAASPAIGGRGGHRVPRSQGRALDRVVEAERELATVVKRQAFRAESGAFARLLGSMAAAAAQHATVLAAPSAVPGGSS